MIPEEAKISIAIELIESKIANCMLRRRETKDEEIEEEYKFLILDRDEIYKGNYKIIDKIIKEAGEDKND